ncbi:MAG: yjeF-like protein hydroxyethylthiazole kinase-related [Planctomycetota bacterium]|nr:MAG: yjeF-like protein hydroxyethylthiazole kinase-related [Planctomycetota bacterium]
MARMKEVRFVPALPARRADAHKGDFGRALIVGGSVGMSGAPMLAAAAALRSGAGLVELAVPWSVYLPAAARLPSALVKPLTETPDGTLDATADEMRAVMEPATAVAIGPGMGKTEGALRTLRLLIDSAKSPVVYDADALNILAAKALDLKKLRRDAVLTPHPGEMARLSGRTRDDVQADRRGVAVAYAKEHGVIVVLKGAQSIVTDGERLFVNSTGSHGLARGGTGDVLAGVAAALLAQKMDPFDAAVLAVHAHGLAGDLAQERLGPTGMTAEDVVEALPEAWKRLERR